MTAAFGATYVSYSQASQKCGYALRFYRERAPEGPPTIGLLIGRAVHAGIEHQMLYGDPAQAVAVALSELAFNLELHDEVRYDPPHRLTRGGEVYRSDRGNAPSLAHARHIVEAEVGAWCERFPDVRVSDPQRIERKVHFEVAPGRLVPCVFDAEPDGGGMLDLKTSGDPWEVVECEDGTLALDPEGKHFDRQDQAQLYMRARELVDGEAPAFFAFHNIPHSALGLRVLEGEGGAAEVEVVGYDPAAIQVVAVEYDRAAAERVVEHRLWNVFEAVEKGVYTPNTSGWWHSERFCSYWSICPLGAAARVGAAVAGSAA